MAKWAYAVPEHSASQVDANLSPHRFFGELTNWLGNHELNQRAMKNLGPGTTFIRLTMAAAAMIMLFTNLVADAEDMVFATPEKLGEALFFDANLSSNRTLSCTWCHAPSRAFIDQLQQDEGQAVPLGPDGKPIGVRNSPTTMYTSFTPPFGRTPDGNWRGGLFMDGRAATLEEQASGPMLNPQEMAMPSKAAVVDRLKENRDYVTAFDRLYGKGTLETPDGGFEALTKAIAAYERTPTFAPFDSRYDRFLRGEVTLSEQEEQGRSLFFASQSTNCSQCHTLHKFAGAAQETFTNYSFHNIGVPPNQQLRAPDRSPNPPDIGLEGNDRTPKDAALKGKFKTPTLRNVAVTAPYMHNGVFKGLRTAILFHNKYNSKQPDEQINPETGLVWDQPEIDGTLSLNELESRPALAGHEIDALVAFLKTLTDRRYGALLK